MSNRLNLDVGTVHANVSGHKVDHFNFIGDGCCVMMCSPPVEQMFTSCSSHEFDNRITETGVKINHKSLKMISELSFCL